MDHISCFKDMFESISYYRKIVLLMFLIKKDADLMNKCGFFKNDINSSKKQFEKLF